MPSRILREGILTSPRMAKLGWAEEVFYRRLHSVVDDFGRYYADQGMLRAACYPRQLSKVSDSDIGKWLQLIADAGLVRVYPAQDGERYLEVLDFGQQVRAKKSKFPEMQGVCVADAKQAPSGPPANAPVFVSVSVIESVSPAPDGADGFEEWWKLYPPFADRKAAKPQCLAEWKAKGLSRIHARVISALRAHKASDKWQQEGGRFIPAPLTWLNQDRWEAAEELAASAASLWFETAPGANAKAAELGLEPWDQTVTFDAFVKNVKRAMEATA